MGEWSNLGHRQGYIGVDLERCEGYTAKIAIDVVLHSCSFIHQLEAVVVRSARALRPVINTQQSHIPFP
jgi:hypothetical protein